VSVTCAAGPLGRPVTCERQRTGRGPFELSHEARAKERREDERGAQEPGRAKTRDERGQTLSALYVKTHSGRRRANRSRPRSRSRCNAAATKYYRGSTRGDVIGHVAAPATSVRYSSPWKTFMSALRHRP
jgi:hypothetical protein